MKNNKEKVVILNYIDKSNTAFNVDKINKLREENLIQYCKDENYEIVKIFNKKAKVSFIEIIKDFMEILKEFVYYQKNFTKIILYDIGEICIYADDFTTINRIIEDKCEEELDIETIKQGNIKEHFNWHYYYENYIDFKYIELDNEKYFIDMEELEYE